MGRWRRWGIGFGRESGFDGLRRGVWMLDVDEDMLG